MPLIIHKATELGIFRAFNERRSRGEGGQAKTRGTREGTKRRHEASWAAGYCSSKDFSALFISVTSSCWGGGFLCGSSGETESRGDGVSPKGRCQKTTRTPGMLS